MITKIERDKLGIKKRRREEAKYKGELNSPFSLSVKTNIGKLFF